ncbi:MAG: hypothetical protein ACK41T_00525 [Pseudobdellovibrio sp.]
MKTEKTSYKPLIFVLIASSLALTALIWLNINDAQRTVPKIKLSYFKDLNEFSSSIEKRLNLEIGQKDYVWIGVEPEKKNQLQLTLLLKSEIEKNHQKPFDLIILDKELRVPAEVAAGFGVYQEVELKENIEAFTDLISKNIDKRILVITASIYSTNLVQKNPYSRAKDILQKRPLTFSMAYFPTDTEDEKNSMFICRTEDNSGTREWGCTSLNKARSVRRRIQEDKIKSDLKLGLMDLTGESDYMILLGK